MSKQETLIIKGIAILMMLFLHLFNNGFANQLQHCFWIDNQPFLHILTRAANPISFFCFCGGYGLYYTYQRGKDSHHYSRILKLYVHYWIVLLIFVPLAHFISSQQAYPGNIQTILYNVTGLDTSWNAECWFVLPYSLLSLTSKRVFAWMDKFRARYVLGITLLLYGAAGYSISRYGGLYLYHHPFVYLPVLYLDLLFPFTIGAMALRTQVLTKVRTSFQAFATQQRFAQPLLYIGVSLLIASRCIINTDAYSPFYMFGMIVLILLIQRRACTDKWLAHLGNLSMEMWLIHSWFCYYLFRNFFYGLKYPIVVFFVLLSATYISAIIVRFIGSRLSKH